MNLQEISELLKNHREFELPDLVVERAFMLALVECENPQFLFEVPEPFRSRIVIFGLSVTNEWYEISSDGRRDYSHHAPALRKLVEQFAAISR
ncbi:hypothetical protein [Pseudoduganella sp. R-34]|uniref:hypothetical protein n=1 Tax=Pseudoduganella sp. R-34 TaxID=3404062 RepID=UPI003CF0A0FE